MMQEYIPPKFSDMYEACLKGVRRIGGNATPAAIYSEVVQILNLSPEVLKIPQGGRNNISKVRYLLGWTLWHLNQTGYIYRPSYGRYSLTEKAKVIPPNTELCKIIMVTKKEEAPPPRLSSNGILRKEPNKNNTNQDGAQRLLRSLKDLDKSGQQLERVVVALLEAMNEYDNIETTPASNDRGIDIIAERLDEFSKETERVVIQVKNYTSIKINNKEIRDLRGSGGYNDRCWYITTSTFTAQAKEEAAKAENKKAVKLTNGLELAYMLIENNVGLKHIFPVDENKHI